jgi:hypothetical protein
MANMTNGEGVLEGVTGSVRLGTVRRRVGERVGGTLRLAGWEAVIVVRD